MSVAKISLNLGGMEIAKMEALITDDAKLCIFSAVHTFELFVVSYMLNVQGCAKIFIQWV